MAIFQYAVTITVLLSCQGVATETSQVAAEDVGCYTATPPTGGNRDGYVAQILFKVR